MKRIINLLTIFTTLFSFSISISQETTILLESDSLNIAVLENYKIKLTEIEKQRLADSIKRSELEAQISSLQTTDNLKKEELEAQIKILNQKDSLRFANKKVRIDSLRKTAKGYPVIGPFKDSLFLLYSKMGSFSPKERTQAINKRIANLASNVYFNESSLEIESSETMENIVFGEIIVMSITETDAIWNNTTKEKLAKLYMERINSAVLKYKAETDYVNLAKKIGLALLVLLIIAALIKYMFKFFDWIAIKIQLQKGNKIKGIQIKDYTLIDAKRQMEALLLLNKVLKWIATLLVIYFSLPFLFGIFPWTENFAGTLFGFIMNPIKSILTSIWNYLPNLATVIVTLIVFRYALRGLNVLKNEITRGNLKLTGFYPEWATPTYQIVRILLAAFAFIVIFPYLPGSDSPVFKAVSVFLGFLFTFGSTGSLSNIISGIIITYMRLFSIGDRVKIGDVTGDVIEKSALVTRIRTSQNEIVSIPNSSIMTSQTTNFSTDAQEKGLIVYSTVTIGYDVLWKDVHNALIEAALRTDLILKEPIPFVLQTSLEDFFVAYKINAYTREANKQSIIYSNLHQNIQDVFNERGIEILSPNYLATRDGNASTIPTDYLKKDYKTPNFNVKKQSKK